MIIQPNLTDIEKGWINKRLLFSEPVNEPTNAYGYFTDKIIIDMDESFDEQPVTILGEKIIDQYVRLSEIKLKDGTIGWTSTRYLYLSEEPIGKSPSNTYLDDVWLYNKKNLEKKVIGKSQNWLIKKYGFPTASVNKFKDNDFGACFFENFEVYKGKSSFGYVRFDIQDDKVITVNLIGKHEYRILAWLPLSRFTRSLPFGNAYRHLPNLIDGVAGIFDDDGFLDKILPGIIFVPIKIIFMIIIFIISFLYTILPIAIVTLIVSYFSLNSDIETSTLILIQSILGFLFGHLWFLFLIYHDSYFYDEPIVAIVCLPFLGSMIIAYVIKTLEYNRCPNCNYWSGFGLGSIWLSSNTSTKTTTTTTYKGGNYAGSSVNVEKTTTDKYEDFRSCSNCGHKWSIKREEVHNH